MFGLSVDLRYGFPWLTEQGQLTSAMFVSQPARLLYKLLQPSERRTRYLHGWLKPSLSLKVCASVSGFIGNVDVFLYTNGNLN